jgi:hypothetical protein
MGRGAVLFWKNALGTVAGAYPLAMFWAGSAGIYLLLRFHVDQTELDEMADLADEPTQTMPELQPSVTGIPSLDPTSAASAAEIEELSTRREIRPEEE